MEISAINDPTSLSRSPKDIAMSKKKSRSRKRKLARANSQRAQQKKLILQMEALEPKQLLTNFHVTSIADDGSGGLTLREAFDQAETLLGDDTITFDFANQTINLTQGELRHGTFGGGLTIYGNGNTVNQTVEDERVFNFTGTSVIDGQFQIDDGRAPEEFDVTIEDLTVSGGNLEIQSLLAGVRENLLVETNHENSIFSGGGIRFNSTGTLQLVNTQVVNNSTSELNSKGGGVFAVGRVVLLSNEDGGSLVSGNSTGQSGLFSDVGINGELGAGGGIYSETSVVVDNSTVSGNRTFGYSAVGGGIAARQSVRLINGAIVENNYTSGRYSHGGGIYAGGNVKDRSTPEFDYERTFGIVEVLDGSRVQNNQTNLRFSRGGGIHGGIVSVRDNSYVTGNSTLGRISHGGGVYASGHFELENSHLTNNSATGGITRLGEIACRVGVEAAMSVVSHFVPAGGVLAFLETAYGYFSRLNDYIELLTGEPLVDLSICPEAFGSGSPGGGAYAGSISIINGLVSGNSTDGYGAIGGAVASPGNITIDNSTFDSNYTASVASDGGAVSGYDVKITNSSFTNNHTQGTRSSGGAIAADILELDRSTVLSNRTEGEGGLGGAISVRIGQVTNSHIATNHTSGDRSAGGAIFGFEQVNVSDSVLSGNFTSGDTTDILNYQSRLSTNQSGGGAIAAQNVVVVNSTLTGNSTTGDEADGGAIYGIVTAIVNSTLSLNQATDSESNGGAVWMFRGAIANATVTGNIAGNKGGGIYSANDLEIGNSIVLGNLAGNPGDGTVRGNDAHIGNPFGATLTSTGSNLIGRPGAAGNQDVFHANLAGSALLHANPFDVFDNTTSFSFSGINNFRGDLADNQGPNAGRATGGNTPVTIRTAALEIVAGNPAIDATNLPASFNLDQRGVERGFDVSGIGGTGGNTDDLGAFEFRPSFVVTNTNTSGTGSLYQAFLSANANPGIDAITFAPSLSGQTIQLSAAAGDQFATLNASDSVIVDASALTDRLTISGTGSHRILDTASDGVDVLTLRGLVLTNGRSLFAGGAIRYNDSGVLTLVNTDVTNSSTFGNSANGGGIDANDAEVILIDSLIQSNFTEGRSARGGGIYADSVMLYNSTVIANQTRYEDTNGIGGADGGGIFARNSAGIYDGSIVRFNQTVSENGNGGGIYADDVIIHDSEVLFNSTSGTNAAGGGVFASDSAEVLNSTIRNNLTNGNLSAGGGLFSPIVILTNSRVVVNSTGGDQSQGGGVFALSDLVVVNSAVNGNTTSGLNSSGGGAYSRGSATITNSTVGINGTFGANSLGGAAFVFTSLALTNSTVTRNSARDAASDNGGIRVLGPANITNSIVLGNYSANSDVNDRAHELQAGTLTFSGNNIVGGNSDQFDTTGYSSTNVSNAAAEDVFSNVALTSGNTSGVYGGLSSGDTFPLRGLDSNPAINGTLAPVSLFSFQNSFDDGFGNNNGQNVGGLYSTYFGLLGRGLNFQGDGTQYVQLGNGTNDVLTIADRSHTVEVWVRVPEVGSGGLNSGERVGVILGNYGNTSLSVNWEIHDDGQMRIFWNQGERNIFGTTDLRDNEWHHLTFVRDTAADEFRFYVDGVEEATTGTNDAGTDFTFTQSHRIGQDNRSSNPVAFHGTLDELTIHETALSEAEIQVRAGRFDQRGEGFDRLAFPNVPVDWVGSNAPHLDLGAIESGIPEQQSLVVTTLDDIINPTDNLTSLREAVLFANSGDADNDGNVNDRITFDASIAGGTIYLADGLGQLLVTESLNITGEENTIQASDFSRVLHFNQATGDLTLSRLHLTQGQLNGDVGGAVRFDSSDTLALNRSRVSSSFTMGANDHGGGIYSAGNLRLFYSALDNNATFGDNAHGGGAYAKGTITIQNSTIYSNFTSGDGAHGGGVFAGNVNGTNSTIVNNATFGAASLGGGIYANDTLSLANMLILGNETNAPGVGSDEFNASSTPALFYGFNLVGETNSNFDAAGSPFSDFVANARIEDVFVDDLVDFEDFIPRIGLNPSSTNPALDSGDDGQASFANLNNDIRLEPRFVDLPTIGGTGAVDLGAFELQLDEEEVRSLVVTTSVDVIDPFDLRVSLSEAIAFANDVEAGIFANGDADNSGSLVDTITFAAGPGEHFSVPRTIVSNGEKFITDSISIIGPGESLLSIDGNLNRIFNLGSSNAAEFFIQGLTLDNGDAGTGDGGAILLNDVDDRLVIDGVRFTQNFGNGGGAISVTNSDFSIYNSSFVGNTANYAGSAIHALGNADGVIVNSTFSANQSLNGFGTIFAQSGDGEFVDVVLRNLTIANNIGSGLGIYSGDGGIGRFTPGNTILANNSAGNAVSSGLGQSVLLSRGNNISDDASGNFNQTGDLINTNPLLAPIDFSLPTWHHELLPGSPAIDGGDNSLVNGNLGLTLVNDQRGPGFDRIVDGNFDGNATVDVGAFEHREIFIVDALGDLDDGDITPGNLTIREAVRLANTVPGHDDIRFDDTGVFAAAQTIFVTSELLLTEEVTISGTAADRLFISGSNSTRIFRIDSVGGDEETYTFQDIALTNADAGSETGGAIQIFGENDTLVLDTVGLYLNRSNGGGAVYVEDAKFIIRNSSFNGNVANASGSAILAFGNTDGFIYNTTIASNSSTAGFGAVFLQTATGHVAELDIRNATIASNIGVGIQVFAGGGEATVQIGNSIVADNSDGSVSTSGTGIAIVDSLGSNISDEVTNEFNQAGDLNSTDPMLGSIGFHGGSTLAFSITSLSPAIDNGNNSIATDEIGVALTDDQRGAGFNRFIDGDSSGTVRVDTGAFEFGTVEVSSRHIFYNDSFYDGNDGQANSADDAAIDLAKSVLLPGTGQATFANYTGNVDGITGLFIDIASLPTNITPSAGDFELFIGNEDNTNNWTLLSVAPEVSIRRGAGFGGTDRITLTWDAGTITNTWLEVNLLANGDNNLGVTDQFYFGNWVGDVSGPGNNDLAIVNSVDFGSVSANFSPFFPPPPPESVNNIFDLNKDGTVNSVDAGIVSNNFTPFFPSGQGLVLINPFSSFTGDSGGNDERNNERNDNREESSQRPGLDRDGMGNDDRSLAGSTGDDNQRNSQFESLNSDRSIDSTDRQALALIQSSTESRSRQAKQSTTATSDQSLSTPSPDENRTVSEWTNEQAKKQANEPSAESSRGLTQSEKLSVIDIAQAEFVEAGFDFESGLEEIAIENLLTMRR